MMNKYCHWANFNMEVLTRVTFVGKHGFSGIVFDTSQSIDYRG